MSENRSGIHIEETLDPSLAVAPGETAVPVFIGEFGDAFSGVTPVSGWLEVDRLVGSADGVGPWLTVGLRAYFQNGGGRCYLANTKDGTLEETLAAVDGYQDVTVLVAPGLWDQGADRAGEWARALAAYAAAHRAMVILHPDRDHGAEEAGAAVEAWSLGSGTRPYAAVYHPWLVPSGQDEAIPPVGAVAGAWAACDRSRGVWKAPANIVLSGATPLHRTTDSDQAAHQSLNFIREFRDRGTLIWGARTLAASDQHDWRHIPVRRLFNAVDRDLMRMLQTVAFEPNTQPTWERVRAAVDTYLYGLWQQGAFQGATQKEAYFVQIGQGVTMTDQDIADHKLILKTGVAAVRPAEFVVLQHTASTAD
ncbi:phage tail sheath C-terminal domain-containing protein [Streptomyces sp. NPDC047071]|uniref:phage tail sheath family protein n=1 Tax=Streptomyces sp. NPDC047071 TaxID=3154808 RepID=UPI003452B954